MADQKTALPIRTEGDAEQKVQVKLVDFVSPAGTEKQMEISEKLAHTRIFAADPAGIKRQVKLSEKGEMAVDGTYDGVSNTNPANIGLVVQERNIASADARQTMKPTAKRGSTDTDVVAQDVALHDHNGNKYTPTNPFPVYNVETDPGNEVVDYKTAASVGTDLSDIHDYSPTAKFTGDHVLASATGKIKVVVQIETGALSGIFNTKFVGFNSVSNPNVLIPLKRIVVGAGIKLRVIVTNYDANPQDVYSTIVGVEY